MSWRAGAGALPSTSASGAMASAAASAAGAGGTAATSAGGGGRKGVDSLAAEKLLPCRTRASGLYACYKGGGVDGGGWEERSDTLARGGTLRAGAQRINAHRPAARTAARRGSTVLSSSSMCAVRWACRGLQAIGHGRGWRRELGNSLLFSRWHYKQQQIPTWPPAAINGSPHLQRLHGGGQVGRGARGHGPAQRAPHGAQHG